jgi:hypothetical protein
LDQVDYAGFDTGLRLRLQSFPIKPPRNGSRVGYVQHGFTEFKPEDVRGFEVPLVLLFEEIPHEILQEWVLLPVEQSTTGIESQFGDGIKFRYGAFFVKRLGMIVEALHPLIDNRLTLIVK